jgi:hypothetical protein
VGITFEKNTLIESCGGCLKSQESRHSEFISESVCFTGLIYETDPETPAGSSG